MIHIVRNTLPQCPEEAQFVDILGDVPEQIRAALLITTQHQNKSPVPETEPPEQVEITHEAQDFLDVQSIRFPEHCRVTSLTPITDEDTVIVLDGEEMGVYTYIITT